MDQTGKTMPSTGMPFKLYSETDQKQDPEQTMLTRKQVKKMCGIAATQTLINYEVAGKLIKHKLAGKVYYKLSDVQNLLTQFR